MEADSCCDGNGTEFFQYRKFLSGCCSALAPGHPTPSTCSCERPHCPAKDPQGEHLVPSPIPQRRSEDPQPWVPNHNM